MNSDNSTTEEVVNKYNILNDSGEVINLISATPEFVEEFYPGHYELVPPPPPIPPDYVSINKSLATQLLYQTDWTAIASVADPAESNPYLTNRQEFLDWRSEVRQVAVNPPDTEWTPPIQPTEQWSN